MISGKKLGNRQNQHFVGIVTSYRVKKDYFVLNFSMKTAGCIKKPYTIVSFDVVPY